VVKQLRKLGQDPLCVVRNLEKAREVLGANAKTAVAELTDRAALERVLQGLDSVFVVTGHDPQIGEQQNNVIDAALQAGVKYLVRVSASRAVASPNSETLVGRAHHAVDERLRNSKLGWVILRPGCLCKTSSDRLWRSGTTTRS
jgi:NAD(P)H dehydrogenase (quinone)